ncbi:hypothetical protein TNCV_211851 [Trichonephila clavipes]|uniref:Uncharacterized protein n=1 Tax=Trichonephila clavipes TaxID=2585209 RepID=A0A8X6T7G7_TRICX|nr:hypothetical protein TNCV_211851 [Trichonephila clavipes]
MFRHYKKDRVLVMGQVDSTQENTKDLGKPRVRRGSQSIAGPSHQIDTRQYKSPTEGSRQGASVQYDRAHRTPGQLRAEKTVPLKGDQSGLDRRQQ